MPNSRRGPPRQQRRRAGRAVRSRQAFDPNEGPVTTLQQSIGPVCRISRGLNLPLTKAAADKGWWFDFSLADVSNSNEFTNLFLEWRLEMVDITMAWGSTTSVASTFAPVVYYAYDPIVGTAITSESAALERSYKVWRPNPTRTTLRIRLRPQVTQLVASDPGVGATVNNALLPRGVWLSTNQPTTGYGALVAWITNYNTANTSCGDLSLYVRYHFSFRGTK